LLIPPSSGVITNTCIKQVDRRALCVFLSR
jgi:hypothetical protein